MNLALFRERLITVESEAAFQTVQCELCLEQAKDAAVFHTASGFTATVCVDCLKAVVLKISTPSS